MDNERKKNSNGKLMIGIAFLCAVIIGAIAVFSLTAKKQPEAPASDASEAETGQAMPETEEEPQSSPEPQKEELGQQEADESKDENLQAEDLNSGAWKSEACYSRAEDGEPYLSSLTEYNSREDMTKQVFYNADGSIQQEMEFENEYTVDGKLAKATELGGSNVLGWTEYEYDGEGRILKWSRYDGEGRLASEDPYSYEYDELTNTLYCDHMVLTYNENGEYAGSGPSNHERSVYDDKNRITAYYSFPNIAQCHMYGQTEAQILQTLQEITPESENPVYYAFSQIIDEYGEDFRIQVYRYDEDGNLEEVDDYNTATGSLEKKITYTYEYDNEGRIKDIFMESESESIHTAYRYDAKEPEFRIIQAKARDTAIREVTWEEQDFSLEKQILRFTLEDGTVIEKEAACEGMVQAADYRDITGDGVNEAIISVYYANTMTEYTLIAVYQVQDGQIVDISPATDIGELADDFWDAEIVKEPVPGYTFVLNLRTYDKVLEEDGPMTYIDKEMTVGYKDQTPSRSASQLIDEGWEVLQ